MAENKYTIREICGDLALDIRLWWKETVVLYFNCRKNAELVKAVLEWEDAHPNQAAPYSPTLTSPSEQGADTLDNMLPACRSCNHYKGRSPLELFRQRLENMPATLLRDNVTYRNAVRFALVTPTPHPVRFYFEDNPPEATP